jgi:hypothetical protein
MTSILLFLQLATAVSARPSPAEAVVMLKRASPDLNLTGVVPVEMYAKDWVPSSTGSTWKQPFSPEEFRPLGVLTVPGITYRLPRAAGYGHRHQQPTTQESTNGRGHLR